MTQEGLGGVGKIAQRWAFLVGIDDYIEPRLSRLNFCVNDVVALEKILTELGYVVVSLHSNHPKPNRQPTKDNVEAELKELCQSVGKDDLLFAHFACHGQLSAGAAIVLMQDSRQALWDDPKKRLAVTEVETMMRESGAKRLVLSLDACHMGVEMGRGEGDDPEFIRNVYELAEGFVVMAGSTAQQKAQEWGAVKHGIYTYYLMKGLLGEAAKSEKSFVSVDDLGKYVVNQLKIWRVANNGVVQEPTVRSEGMGDIILADWRDREPSQVSIEPPEVQLQVSNPNVRGKGQSKLSETRRKTYVQQLAIQQAELAAVRDDWENCQTAKQRLKYGKDMEKILQEIEELENKLSD